MDRKEMERLRDHLTAVLEHNEKSESHQTGANVE